MRPPISELYPWESVIFSATRTRLAEKGVAWAIEEVNTLREGPDALPEDIYNNLFRLFRTVIDPISVVLGQPLFISSSYRSLELDRAVAPDHYADKTSDYRGIHTFGRACDISLYNEYALGDFGRLIRFPGASSLNLPLWYAITEYKKQGFLSNLTSYALGSRYQKSIVQTSNSEIIEFNDYDHIHLAIDEKRLKPFVGPEDGSVIPNLSVDGISLLRSLTFKAPNSMAWFYRRVSHVNLTELGTQVADNLGQPLLPHEQGTEAEDYFQNREWKDNHWDGDDDGLTQTYLLGNDGADRLYPGIDVSEANGIIPDMEVNPLIKEDTNVVFFDALDSNMSNNNKSKLDNANSDWHNLYP